MGVGTKKRDFKRRKKKVPSQLVSFDEDSGASRGESPQSPIWVQSAPTTCLNSPALSSHATPYANSLSTLSSTSEGAVKQYVPGLNDTLEHESIVDKLLETIENDDENLGPASAKISDRTSTGGHLQSERINFENSSTFRSLPNCSQISSPNSSTKSNIIKDVSNATSGCSSTLYININATENINLSDGLCEDGTADARSICRSVSVSSNRFDGNYSDVLEELMSSISPIPVTIAAAVCSSPPAATAGFRPLPSCTNSSNHGKGEGLQCSTKEKNCGNFPRLDIRSDYFGTPAGDNDVAKMNNSGENSSRCDLEDDQKQNNPTVSLGEGGRNTSINSSRYDLEDDQKQNNPTVSLGERGRNTNCCDKQETNSIDHVSAESDQMNLSDTIDCDHCVSPLSPLSPGNETADVSNKTVYISIVHGPHNFERVTGLSDAAVKSEAGSEFEFGSYKSSLSNLSVGSNISGDTDGTGAVMLLDVAVNGSTCDGGGVTKANSRGSLLPQQIFSSSLTREELCRAAIDLGRSRETSDKRRRNAEARAEAAESQCEALRQELDEEKRASEAAVATANTREQQLRHENQLLRTQLGKYISAVQLLQPRNVAQEDTDLNVGAAEATTSTSVTDTAPTSTSLPFTTRPLVVPPPPPPKYRDYHNEAAAYESKLIQVTEFRQKSI